MKLPATDELWIVEDDPSTLELLSHALAVNGRRLLAFGSADAAERELEKSVPAVVVVDRILGADDGLALIARIRAAAWPVPAILISGDISPTLTAHAMRAGVSMVVEKPFDVDYLLQETELAFQQSSVRLAELQRRRKAQDSLRALSNGHIEVLRELVSCRPHKQIASRLDIALRTVEKRKKEIFDRLGVDTFTELLTLLQDAEVDLGGETMEAGREFLTGGHRGLMERRGDRNLRVDDPHPGVLAPASPSSHGSRLDVATR